MLDELHLEVSTGRDDKKKKPEFFSIEDVVRHFDKNPANLISYIEMGLYKGLPIVATHIAQVAKMAGEPLISGTATFRDLPPVFMKPNNFSNIDLVIQMARSRIRH